MGFSLGYGLGFKNKLLCGNFVPTPSIISKFSSWFKLTDYTASYFIDQVGTQEREILTENGVAGVIHPGRALQFDVAKTQYCRTNAVQPSNFRLINNSLTFSFWFKMAVPPTGDMLICGGETLADGGNVYITANATTGWLGVKIRHSSGLLECVSTNKVICDNIWHHIFVVVNKSNELELWIDNNYQNSVSIIGLTFGDVNKRWYMFHPSYQYGVRSIRDFRLFPLAITSSEDRFKALQPRVCRWGNCVVYV